MKKLLFSILLFSVIGNTVGQVSITNAAPSATVNFSNTMQASVGSSPSTAWEGDGFGPNPTTAGRLNSNAWEVKGWNYGNLLFGGTQTVDDYARASVTGAVITPGMYAFTELPGSVANPALLIQPETGDFSPGSITLKIRNNGTSNLTQIAVSYNVFIRNDENASSSFNFSHSDDNLVFQPEPLLDYISPDVADAFQWVNIGFSPSRSIVIPGVNIAPGGFYYIRWSISDVSGAGAKDEFGLDDIVIDGTYGVPAPEINVQCYGATLLTGDTTPTVGEGTDFAPSFAPISTLLTTQNITFYIQNLGGIPLNISNVTITGVNASDFTIFGGTSTGPIAAASATISSKPLSIIFDPSGAGLRRARINIFSDDSNENPYWFDIQGYGVIPIPDIRINGGPIGTGLSVITSGSMIPNVNNNTLYATQTVGVTSLLKNFVIRNDCPQNAPLIFTGAAPYVTIGGTNPSDFILTTPFVGNTLNPGFTKTFAITFSPTGSGIRTALVSVASDDPDENPYTFLVQGMGISPEMDVTGNTQPVVSGSTTPSFVNHTFFDYLNIGTGTLDRTFTITNSGTAALTVGSFNITGAQAADFTVITPPASSIAIGATTTFTIRFDPSASGLRNATVNMISNDFNETPYTFAISGYGLDYIPCALGAIETIATQDFEAAPAAPAWPYGVTGTTSIAAGTGFGGTGDGGLSDKFLGGRSLQVANGTGTVTMTNLNTTQYNDIELNLRLASFGSTAVEGADATDRITVAISSNGGTTWSNELEVSGYLDSKWSFATGTGLATTVFDNNNVVTALTNATGGYQTTTGYSTISISGLPKVATLAVRVTLANNSVSEIWALDNVTLFGRKEVSTTWNGSNWTPSAPTPTTKAIVDGTYSTAVNGNIQSCKCEIKAGRTVTINAGNYIEVQSDIDNSGSLIVESSGSLVQRNDFATNTGVVKVKRNTTAMKLYDYTYWSSPVSGQTLFGLSPATQPDKYYSFSPTIGNWVSIMNGAAPMLAGKGYIVRAPNSHSPITGTVFMTEFNGPANNGFIQTPITLGVSNMNLIGNPYSSAISANAFLSNSANTGVVEGTIYLWTHNTNITNQAYTSNDYAVYNFSGAVATAPAINSGVNNTMPTGNIASGQGFFIKGLANGQVSFTNSMRLTGSNSAFFRMENDDNTNDPIADIERHRVWLNLSNSDGAFKQTLVGYIEGATNDVDRGFDGELFNANTFISIYSIAGNTNFAIQGRALPFNESDRVTLGYSSTVAGLFNISIESVDGLMEAQNIYLEDKLLNITHDLKQAPYSFTTEIGTFNDRFELKYNMPLATNNFDIADNEVIVAVKDNQITVFSGEEDIKSIMVFDLLGRIVYEETDVHSKKHFFPNPVRNQQALVVRIVSVSGRKNTRKIVL